MTFDLYQLHKDAESISRAMNRLEGQLRELTPEAEDTESELSPEDIDRLINLNRRLKELERSLVQINHELIPRYVAKAAQAHDPMGDYEFDVEIAYVLREDDPEWREESDNILTRRLDSMSKDGKRIRSRDSDFCESLPRYASIRHEPHCHLFHDLYDHSYGLDMPSLSLKDCTRVGSIWVDVIIRQQYFLDVASGTWSKSVPAQPAPSRQAGQPGERDGEGQ